MSAQPRFAIAVPFCGFAFQDYIRTRFNHLPADTQMICFRMLRGGWSVDPERIAVLAGRGLTYRIIDRIVSRLKMAWLGLTRGSLAIVLPVGWKGVFMRAVRSRGIGAVLAMYGGTGAALLPALTALGIPFGVTFEGSDAQMSDHNARDARRLRALWSRADLCVFVSRFLMEQAVARGCPRAKCRVIHNGTIIPVETQDRRTTEGLRLVCVANFHPVKGHAYLVQGFLEALERMPALSLTLVGSGPGEREIRDICGRSGRQDHVRFTGGLPWDGVQAILKESDIYIQTGVRADDGTEEGLGLSVIEAQAHGLPAIVTDSGGMPEIVVHEETGLVIPQKDSRAAAEAICRIAADHRMRMRMSRSAYLRMKEQFSLEAQMREFNRVRSELLEMGSRS